MNPHASDIEQDALCRTVVGLIREVLKTDMEDNQKPVSDSPSLIKTEEFVFLGLQND